MVRQLLAVSPVTVLGLYSHITSPPQPRLMLVHYWVTTVPVHWVSVRQSVTLCAKCPAYCWHRVDLRNLGSHHPVVLIRFPVKEGPRHSESHFRQYHLQDKD